MSHLKIKLPIQWTSKLIITLTVLKSLKLHNTA